MQEESKSANISYMHKISNLTRKVKGKTTSQRIICLIVQYSHLNMALSRIGQSGRTSLQEIKREFLGNREIDKQYIDVGDIALVTI